MRKENLYRYTGIGGTIDSTILLDAPHELRYRIYPDEGMLLTNGDIVVDVQDVSADEIDLWTEIPQAEAKGGEQ